MQIADAKCQWQPIKTAQLAEHSQNILSSALDNPAACAATPNHTPPLASLMPTCQ
jgi:hypothetical protein